MRLKIMLKVIVLTVLIVTVSVICVGTVKYVGEDLNCFDVESVGTYMNYSTPSSNVDYEDLSLEYKEKVDNLGDPQFLNYPVLCLWYYDTGFINAEEMGGIKVQVKDFNEISTDLEINYNTGHTTLEKNEIILSKWDYYAYYYIINSYEINIGIEAIEMALDDIDCYEKEYLLIKSMSYIMAHNRGLEARALTRYGVIPDDIDLDMLATFYESKPYGGVEDGISKDYKIVGYYENSNDDLPLTLEGEEMANYMYNIYKGLDAYVIS
jgi:hypothetical protein